MKKLFIIFLLVLFAPKSAFSMPEKIIIIRHSDGYYVPAKGDEMGPALSGAGYYRTFAFLKYYLEELNKAKGIPFPSYIIACNPYSEEAHHKMAKSVRHIQTVAPLVSWMYEHRPDDTPQDLLQIPYRKLQYKKLAKLITDEEYMDNRVILVCWSHSVIHKLIDSIREFSGYTMESNWPDNEKWKGGDYETIVIINFDNSMKSMSVNRIKGAIKIPATQQGKDELIKWFFSQFKQ